MRPSKPYDESRVDLRRLWEEVGKESPGPVLPKPERTNRDQREKSSETPRSK
jgi:hypothetical protein